MNNQQENLNGIIFFLLDGRIAVIRVYIYRVILND